MDKVPLRRVARRELTGSVRSFKHLPVIPIAGAIVQLTIHRNRCPPGGLRIHDNPTGQFDLSRIGRKGLQNRQNLRRVNAPHAGIAQLATGPPRRRLNRLRIIEFGNDAMRRRLAKSMTGAGNFDLRASTPQ